LLDSLLQENNVEGGLGRGGRVVVENIQNALRPLP